MRGRPYAKQDMKGMQEALAILTAYDMGTEPNEFGEFVALVRESNRKTTEHMAQLAWLLLRTAATTSGTDKEELLRWYGQKFATSELGDD